MIATARPSAADELLPQQIGHSVPQCCREPQIETTTAASPVRLCTRVSAELAEELPHIADQQVWCFHGGEVAAAAELGPVHDVVVAFSQRPDGGVAGEHRHRGGHWGL